jgi:hypothetical protein
MDECFAKTNSLSLVAHWNICGVVEHYFLVLASLLETEPIVHHIEVSNPGHRDYKATLESSTSCTQALETPTSTLPGINQE